MSIHPVVTKTNDPTPLYYQFGLHVRRRIERGEWGPGDRLLAEPDLAREYGLSRGTIREGLSYLAREGLIERQHGRGTFVRDNRIVSEWNTFQGFTAALRAQGHDVAGRLVSVQVGRAGDDVGRLLDVAADEPVIQLRRVVLANGQPLIVVTDYLVEHLYPGIAAADFSRLALAEILEGRYGVRFARRERWIEPILPSRSDRQLLGLKSRTPCLLIDQLHWSREGKPVMFNKAIVRGDRCRHHVQLGWP